MIYKRKTYTSCGDLPLRNFIKLVVHEDYEQLYSEPKTVFNKNIDLTEITESIFDEYGKISNNKKADHILALIKEITVINNKLDLVSAICAFLLKQIDPELVGILRRMGFAYSYSKDTIQKDVDLTLISSKRMIIKRQELDKEYQDLNESGGKATESDFNSLIAHISKFMGFMINSKDISVIDWCNYLLIFNQQNSKNG